MLKERMKERKGMGNALWLIVFLLFLVRSSAFRDGDEHLLPLKLRRVQLGTLMPQGWLRRQIEIEAEGLAGHLQRFWPDVQNSSWIGGLGDEGLHERLPYWLNGIVPLLFQIPQSHDVRDRLRGDVDKIIGYILQHQQADGSLGPQDMFILKGEWFWSKFPLLMALEDYAEALTPAAHNYSQIVTAIEKCMEFIDKALDGVPLEGWSAARWQDMALVVQWMYDRSSNASQKRGWQALLHKLHSSGYDWNAWFSTSQFPTSAVTANFNLFTHGVNNAQGAKTGAVWYRVSGNSSDLHGTYTAFDVLKKYHGQATGMFGCDEHLAGRMPSRGSELCSVVEYMFSYEVALSVTGDLTLCDDLERLAFNALPAEMTKDMWAHQYLQEVNQFHAEHIDGKLVWPTDGPDSLIFGLEPNYGCCTANFDQGWTKFVAHVLFERLDDAGRDATGLTLTSLVPFSARHPKFGSISVETNYPFDDKATLTLECATSYTFSLRIPSFITSASVVSCTQAQIVRGGSVANFTCTPSEQIVCKIFLEIDVSTEVRYNNAVSVFRGPLLFALHPGEHQTILKNYSFESRDLQIENTTAWNMALGIKNASDPRTSFSFFRRNGGPSSSVPFSTRDPPCLLIAQAAPLDTWGVDYDVAAPPPQSPVDESVDRAKIRSVIMLPYGATNLRLGELPFFTDSEE